MELHFILCSFQQFGLLFRLLWKHPANARKVLQPVNTKAVMIEATKIFSSSSPSEFNYDVIRG